MSYYGYRPSPASSNNQYSNNNSFSYNNKNNNSSPSNNNSHHDSPLREVPLFQSVRIRVGMKIIYTTMHTLQQSPTSVLAQLFSPPFPLYDELEEIHRYPHEYVSETAFLHIIDVLRSGEWVPCRTTDEREDLLRAIAILEIKDLPDVPLAADHSFRIEEGGTELFYQHVVATENIKELKKKLKDREEKQAAYLKKKKETDAAKKKYEQAEVEYSSAQSIADQYRAAADEISNKQKDLEARKEKVMEKFKELSEKKEDIASRLNPLQEENDEKQRDARKAKFAHVQQMELSDAAADAAKAAEQPQPNGADPIKDETLEAAAEEARKVTEEAKALADEKAKLAAESQEKFMVEFQEMEKLQIELDEVVVLKEELEQSAGSSSVQIEERIKLAEEAEEEARPLKEKRDSTKEIYDKLQAECESMKPKSPEEEDAEDRKRQELLEEKIFIEEPHPQSILPIGSPRIIPRQVRKLGLKGYKVRGEIRGDIEMNPQPISSSYASSMNRRNPSGNNPFENSGIGGGMMPNHNNPIAAFGGFGGNAVGRRGGFGHRTIGGTNNSSSNRAPTQHQQQQMMNMNNQRTPSQGRNLMQQQQPERGVSEVSTTNNNNNIAGSPNAGGAVAPFSGSRTLQFCDTTSVLMEKELERLDHLMMLAYEAPSGDFFREKKPTGSLQELIESCVL